MELKAIIEIPKHSIYKYELDKDSNELKLDRVLTIPCPFNYGFIPNTLSEDGDPLDIFIVSADIIVPKSEVKFKPWGILLCKDQGVEDNKVIAVIEGDSFRDFDYFKKIRFYLEHYKTGFEILEYKIFNDDVLFSNFIKKDQKSNQNPS